MTGDLPAPTGPGWPVRLSTHLWNPAGTTGRALLLHGLGSDGTCWWRLASQLADLGYLVVAPDLRSHGDSPTAVDHRIATLTDDVVLVGDGWDLVVGHSLGGAIAADLLARDDVEVAAAVLIDPVLVIDADDRDDLRAAQRADVGDLGSPVAFAARHPRWHPRDVERKRAAAAEVSPQVVDLVFDHNDPWDVTDRVAAWQGRAHVVAADPGHGALFPAALGAALRERSGVSVETVEGAGHSVHRDDPDAVWSAVQRVVAEPFG